MSRSIERIDAYRWRLLRTYKPGMLVEGIIYSSEKFLEQLIADKALEQVANVACLPGIVKASLAMPDIHWGYGFPIGGVAATNIDENGVISPGGVGFDINCGVRLINTSLLYKDIAAHIPELIKQLYHVIPAGVGSKGDVKLSVSEQKQLLLKGAAWAVNKGFGDKADLEYTEEKGQMQNADPEAVSEHAYARGKMQAGTLGSGNHFLELQAVDAVFDAQACAELAIAKGQVVLMIHTGSRGFGHQVCSDYVKIMLQSMSGHGIHVPDRQLACAPVQSKQGQAYLGAMACAANYAWCNRQILMHKTREVFERFFNQSWQKLRMNLVYDIAHNIAKIEKHCVNGKKLNLCVHRKGATRAFAAQSKELPPRYKNIGQPVIIPGDMGTNSYLLAGTQTAMEETFGSTCHGAGRLKSRTQAIRTLNRNRILEELKAKGIVVYAQGKDTICEEAPQAYKDINEVIDIVHNAGISKKLCRMRPLAVIKG